MLRQSPCRIRNPPVLAVVCLNLIFSLPRAEAWDISGHMIVAQVAYSRLNTNAAAHLALLASQVTFRTNHYNAVNVAGWADDIKHAFDIPDAGHYKNWHFIDLGVPDSHFDLLTNPPPLTIENGDIVSALKRCVAVAKGGSDPLIPDEATAVALIVHLMGDIHQPLHCASHYYTNQPGTDGGGNDIALSNFQDTYTNLHSFWDKAYKVKRAFFTGTITSEPDLPTFETSPNDPKVSDWMQTVMESAPPAGTNLKPDFEAWALETHALAASEAYGKLSGNIETTPRKLTSSYVKNARKVARAQLCLAGYRLAELLNELYPAN